MKIKFVFFMFVVTMSWADWVSLTNIESAGEPASVILQTKNAIFLEVQISGFSVTEIEEDSVIYQRLFLPEIFATCLDIGKPEIPAIVGNIGVPRDCQVSCEIVEAETEVFHEYIIYPYQKPAVDNRTEQDFTFDHDFYMENVAYPEPLISVSDSKIWRDMTIINLRVFPFQYNPKKEQLTVYKKLVARIDIIGGKDEVITVSPRYDQIYRTSILNYDWMNIDVRPAAIHYLAIVYDDYIDAVRPLTDWYHKKGIHVDITPSSIVGSDAIQIKNYIINHYNTFQTDYVLLVGDIAQIPSYEYVLDPYHSYVSDAWYSFIENNDVYAELAIGRLSAESTTQIHDMVNKILEYEHNPPLDDWLLMSSLVAHCEKYPAKYSQCKREIHNCNYSYFNPIMDTIMGYFDGQNNVTVASAINQGRSVINYRGHGHAYTWDSWTYDGPSYNWGKMDVYALNNGDRTPIVFNICCFNGNIDAGEECLCEAWVRKNPGGAIAALGASYGSWPVENHVYDKELYKAFCNSTIWNIGWMSNYAAAQIIPMGQLGVENVTMYLWVGDPMTEIRTSLPGNLTVDHPSEIPVGTTDFQVSVTSGTNPVINALVCVMKDEEVWETAFTDINGIAMLQINPVTTGILDVTVTKHNYLPYEGEAFVINEYHMMSNSQNALDGNNQHKLVRDMDGNIHLVYHSFWLHSGSYGDVWYTRSTDDGTTWSPETYIGNGFEPCISLDEDGTPCVMWAGPSHKSLRFRRCVGDQWSDVYVIDLGWWSVIGPHLWHYPSMIISGTTVYIATRYDSLDINERKWYYTIRYATMNINDPVNTFTWNWHINQSDITENVGNVGIDIASYPLCAYRFDFNHVYYKDNAEHSDITGDFNISTHPEIGNPSIKEYSNNPFIVWPAYVTEGIYETYVIRGMYRQGTSWTGITDITNGCSVYPVSPYIAGPDRCVVWADPYQQEVEGQTPEDYVFCAKDGWESPKTITHDSGNYDTYDPHGVYVPLTGKLYVVYCANYESPYDIVFKVIDMNEYPERTLSEPSDRTQESDDAKHEQYSFNIAGQNPFSKRVTLQYELPDKSYVSLKIYDASGRLVRTLEDAFKPAGVHGFMWDGRDLTGRTVARGVYFAQIISDEFVEVEKLLLVR